MNVFSTLHSMPPLERRLLSVALPLVVVVRLALWILPSRTILRGVRAISPSRPAPNVSDVDVKSVVWAVEAASRRVPRATCLTQAIAVQLLLRRHEHSSQLCLGVAREIGGGFRAHAWVERNGRVVIGANGVRDLTRLPDLEDAEPYRASLDTA
jgi:hypothetical protein